MSVCAHMNIDAHGGQKVKARKMEARKWTVDLLDQ